MSVGRFCWHDLMTHDTATSRAFYEGLLGWTAAPQPNGYTMINDGHGNTGGYMTIGPEAAEMPSHWVPYVSVDDVDAAVAQIDGLGGRLIHGPVDIGDGGRFAVVADDQGAAFRKGDPQTSRSQDHTSKTAQPAHPTASSPRIVASYPIASISPIAA